ncbi:MAG TPA: hypothetical protein VNZ64_21125 [Candidatus Acidoferrum sp.]|jgi:hypothetical protein|nr:hypothetical protein [Candidatus Acidoferrum sp.]
MNATRDTYGLSRKGANGPVWLATNRAAYVIILALALGGGFLAPAQDTNAPPATNDVAQAEEMVPANDNGQTEGLSPGDEMVDTNNVAETNNQATGPGEDARSRRLRRQRQNRSRGYGQTNGSLQSGASATNNGPASLDYSAFRMVAERNIFDPNRAPHNIVDRPQRKTIESFSLVGTMSYEKGDFAFFDGPSSDYKKVLKASGTIAGYKVLAVLPDSVTLARATNELVLAVGAQLRRQDDGTWVQEAGAAAYDASPAGSNSTAQPETAASGAESDIIKRMMQRREKE